MTLPLNDPVYYSLKLFKVCGLHPKSKSKILNVYYCFNNCCFVFILSLATTGFITGSYKNNIFEAVENLQTIFLYIHIAGKYPVLFLKKSALLGLLDQRKKFWSIEDFDPSIRKECEEILIRTAKFVRNFIVITFLVIMNFFLQPFLTGELPVRVYIPTGWYPVIHMTFWYLIPTIMGSIYGPDFIFCSICIPVMIQFKLVAYKLENLKVATEILPEMKSELRKIVDHQNFLIEYCEEINKYSDTIFLNQVIVSTALICMQLFIASQKEFLLPNKLKCLGYCLMEVIETAIYCFNAELLSDASENVGTAAYNSKWFENNNVELRKFIVLVMSRSQKKIIFNGMGLVFINLKTFTQIFKTAMSFYSYLNTMVSFE